ISEIAVARRVDGLHRGDDPERAEAREIIGAHQLDVLDLLPQLRRAGSGGLDRVERDVHRAIADGMDGDRDTGGGRHRDVVRELTRLDGEDAAIPRTLVGLLERGGLRAERAVGEDLEVPGAEPLVALSGTHALLE